MPVDTSSEHPLFAQTDLFASKDNPRGGGLRQRLKNTIRDVPDAVQRKLEIKLDKTALYLIISDRLRLLTDNKPDDPWYPVKGRGQIGGGDDRQKPRIILELRQDSQSDNPFLRVDLFRNDIKAVSRTYEFSRAPDNKQQGPPLVVTRALGLAEMGNSSKTSRVVDSARELEYDYSLLQNVRKATPNNQFPGHV